MANGLQWSWTVFCETEGTNVIVNQKSKPTACPNDAGHTINTSSLKYEVNLGTNVIYNPTKNQGFYCVEGINFSCPGSTTTTYDVKFDYDIIILGGYILPEDTNAGDNLAIIMTPDLTVGVLTAAANTSDTTLTVSATVIQNIVKGCNVKLGSDEYVVKNVDLMNNQLILASALINSYSIGTSVKRNLYVVKNILLSSRNRIELGALNPSKTYVPAGYIFRFLYTNNTGTTKTFNFVLEHI